MKYVGSKRRIANHFLPIMLAERKPGTIWVEPFVGGANMIDKVPGERIGNDINPYLIALLKAVQAGWIPPTDISREEYRAIRRNLDNYPPELTAFVMFCCSYGGYWDGGYALNKDKRNYAAEGSRALTKQAANLVGVEFVCGDYQSLKIPAHSLIYCDPPYASVKYRLYRNKIDHEQLFAWCRAKAKEGHTVFISEYNAPADFVCVKIVKTWCAFPDSKIRERVEKLYRCYA